jgi:hypothetical protein
VLSLNPNSQPPILGVRQFCGTLIGSVITLSGLMVRRRWGGSTLTEMKPVRRRDSFRAEAGNWLCLWGPRLDETEAARLVSRDGQLLAIQRYVHVVADGAVQVVVL